MQIHISVRAISVLRPNNENPYTSELCAHNKIHTENSSRVCVRMFCDSVVYQTLKTYASLPAHTVTRRFSASQFQSVKSSIWLFVVVLPTYWFPTNNNTIYRCVLMINQANTMRFSKLRETHLKCTIWIEKNKRKSKNKRICIDINRLNGVVISSHMKYTRKIIIFMISFDSRRRKTEKQSILATQITC